MRSAPTAITARRSMLEPKHRRSAGASRACRRSIPNDFATGIDRATWDVAQHRQAAAAAGSRHPGTLSSRDRPSRSWSRRRRSKKASSRRSAQIYCPGRRHVLRPQFFACHAAGGHGHACDLRHAIEQSCNAYFYTVGNMLGVDKIHKWSTQLGLALKSGIDLPNEVRASCRRPSGNARTRRTTRRWYPGETISVAIGQGQLSVTPMSMAVMIADVGQRRHARRCRIC